VTQDRRPGAGTAGQDSRPRGEDPAAVTADRKRPKRAGDRSWNVALLAAYEPGRRNRRTIDSVLLAWAAVVIGLSAVIAASAPKQDNDVAEALRTVLAWAGPLWRVSFFGLIGLAIAVVVQVIAFRRRSLERDLLVTAVVLAAMTSILGQVVEDNWFPVDNHVLSRWGYPELRLAAATAVLVVVGPELVRTVRLAALWLVPFASVGAVVLGAVRPSGVLGGLALGIGAGALVRLVFGTASAVPPTGRVRDSMAELGVTVAELVPSTRQHMGYADYVGRDEDGRSLKVRVLGRDAEDTQRLARRWRLFAYRDPPRSAPVGRLEQVEHEALATLMAREAGVRVPEVVVAALGPHGDAVFAARQPDTDPLELADPDQVSDELLEALWEQVARLHGAGISHGRLNASNVLQVDGRPMIVDLSAATLGAPQSAIDIDVAELLVACTVLVGPDRALRHALSAGHGDAVARALPYLQRAALTPHLRDLARTHEVGLKDLRTAAAEATGQQLPDLVPMRRVRPRDFLITAMIAVAAYLIITQLAEIGFGTIADELRSAEVAWIVVGLILAQLTFVGRGISLRGAVPTPLPLLPCVVVQSAIKFINMTVPSSAGRIALSVRFLQRMGAPTPEAVAAGAVDDASETLVQLALVLVTIPFVDVAINAGALKGGVPPGRIILAVLALLALMALAIAFVPRVREKVLPPIRAAASSLWAVARDRRKRLELFGGNAAAEMLYALTLGSACLAYGVHLNFAQLLFVNEAAAALSGLVPVPGGVGAAEASITAGLVAMGVDDSTAFAIAFTHRLCTYYLPPIWGYFSMQWLRRKAYI
jgi:glycosyltransferase 2 family protein